MATVNKDFKIKSGLIVEGTTATVNGFDVLTKKTADQTYIVNLIGGTATSANEADKVVKRDANGDFAAGEITADLVGNVTGNADTASALETSRKIELQGDVSGNTMFDGSGDAIISVTLNSSFATEQEVTSAIAQSAGSYLDWDGQSQINVNTQEIAQAFGQTFDSYGSASLAQSAAEATASADATYKADAALASANSYTDDEVSALDLSLKAYADQAEADAISTASADATSKANAAQAAAEATASADATSKANAAQAAAELTASNANSSLYTTVTGDIATAKSEAISSANAYTDAEVAALVGQAPELLDTLNELAAAIADNPNYATDVANLVATKADTTYVDGEISDLDTSAQGYASAAQSAAEATASADATYKANAAEAAAIATAALDATSKANGAETDANNYTDGKITQEVADRNSAISSAVDTEVTNRNSAITSAIGQEIIDRNSAITTAVNALATTDIEEGSNLYFTNQRAIDAVTGTIDNAINALDTDDIEEGVNQYFTDYRAKVSAVDLLTNATKENIQITWTNQGGLVIAAENGVADSTTNDLTEGTNLYFTDERALSAISGENIQPQSIDITWVRREEATWTDVSTASKATCHSAGTSEGSMKYLVRVTASVGGTRHSHVTEVLATVDGANGVAIVEYGTIYTSAEPLATVTVEWNAATSKYDLNVTTANNSSEVMVAATLMATLD